MAGKKAKKNAEAWVRDGFQRAKASQFFDAIECFQKALELDPDLLDAWFYLGAANEKLAGNPPGIMARQDLYLKAIQAYDKVVTIDSKHAKAWNHKGYCYERLANYTHEEHKRMVYFNKSKHCFEKVLVLEGKNADVERTLQQLKKRMETGKPDVEPAMPNGMKRVKLKKAEREQIQSQILDYIKQETGLGAPLRPHCEFEELTILKTEEYLGGRRRIVFLYNFDEDGFAMYDKTVQLMGYLWIDQEGGIIGKELKVTHIGVAAHFEPNKELL